MVCYSDTFTFNVNNKVYLHKELLKRNDLCEVKIEILEYGIASKRNFLAFISFPPTYMEAG
jgi:hypothetical protein